MRTDIELIESFLSKTMSEEDSKTFALRRTNDRAFGWNIVAQAKVHLAALMYGRNLRRTQILAASENAFSDKNFNSQISAIFK